MTDVTLSTGFRRITQKDVAKQAGVHRSTVSLVFKNHPSIPESTKTLVYQAAKDLGYQPDPMLSALAAYRISSRPVTFQGTLAWLVNHHGEKFHWENIPIYQEYFQGARERAANSGYLLEVFDVNLHGMKAGRLASILRAQNIRGILLCPQPHSHAEVEFPWENFSTVTIGYSLSKPQLHVAAATQYRNAVSAVKHLRSYGYQHIGYVVWPDFDQRSDSNYLAGYLAETFSQNKNLSMSSLVADYDSLEAFQAWYEKFRPDAIVTADAGILDKIKLMGLKVPRDLGVACFALSNIESPLAGIHENTSHIGAIALDFLIGMIHRGEQGIPEIPQRILIEGTWVHAPSLKKSLH